MDTPFLEVQLPFGYSSFAKLRKDKKIYVDKSHLLARIAQNGSSFFIARPRRFGKSLLVSTFKSLFTHGLSDFAGLNIEKMWTDHTYRVLHLDFSICANFDTIDGFQQSFTTIFDRALIEGGFDVPPPDRDAFRRFFAFLSAQPLGSLVLLIDEYDAPLTQHLDNSELFKKVQDKLSSFYLFVKHCDANLRFLFITGITKFQNTGIFSAFNSLNDITLNPDYSTLLGYTKDEILENFGAHINHAAQMLSCTPEHILEELKTYFDGYCFDELVSAKVFNPWSVLSFFYQPKIGFQNHWYASGGKPNILLKYLAKHVISQEILFKSGLSILRGELYSSYNFDTMNPKALLVHTGYLTITKRLNPFTFQLDYPNKEVRQSLEMLYADELLSQRTLSECGIGDVHETLQHGEAADVVDMLNLMLAIFSQ